MNAEIEKDLRGGTAPGVGNLYKWGLRTLLLLTIIALVIFGILPKMKARQVVPPPAAARPMVVETVVVSPQTIEFTRNYTARITDNGRTKVSAQLSSTLSDVRFQEGDFVTAGDVLAVLDTQDMRAELGRATASVAQVQADIVFAENQVSIDRKLFQGGAIPKTALDESERKLEVLRASARQQESGAQLAQQKLGYGRISAPVSGRIQAVHVRAGEHVAPGSLIMEIVGSDNYKAVITIPERDMSSIAVGDLVYIQTPEGGEWLSTIGKIYPALDDRTHTGTVDVLLGEDVSRQFFAGSLVQTRVVYERQESVLAVPTQAIFHRGGTYGVFAVVDSIAHWKSVKIGLSDGVQTIITDGLSADDQAIITPYPALNEGSKVMIAAGGSI